MSDDELPSAPPLPGSWADDENEAVRQSGKHRRLWWILAVVVVVAIGAAVAAVLANGGVAPQRAWPASVGGRPEGLGGEKDTAADVTPTAPAGVYIWQSFDGWHLWAVNGDGLDGVKGTIESSDKIVQATSSAPDAGTVTVDGKTITFDLDGKAAVAGVDFDAGFSKKLTFDLEGPDGPIPATVVFTGSKAKPVDAVPVVIDKPVVMD